MFESLHGSGQAVETERPAWDQLRYSREVLTLGRDGVEKVANSRAAVIGLGAVGAEISKNLVLAGVRWLTLVDEVLVKKEDFAAQFLVREADLGKNRAEASVSRLQELADHTVVSAFNGPVTEALLRNCTAVVVTEGTQAQISQLNIQCRSLGIKFILAQARGLCSRVFVDFGDSFQVQADVHRSQPELMVESITQDLPATVTVAEDHRHNLLSGDYVSFMGLKGLEALNACNPVRVTVTGQSSFTIPVDTRPMERHITGGYIRTFPRPIQMSFLSLEDSLASPKFAESDPANPALPRQLHAIFHALGTLEQQETGPESGSDGASNLQAKLAALASEYLQKLSLASACHSGQSMENQASNGHTELSRNSLSGQEDKTTPLDGTGGGSDASEVPRGSGLWGQSADALDEPLLRAVIQGDAAELSPVAAVTGGIAAQEVLKACTGLHTPLQQWLYFSAAHCLPDAPAAGPEADDVPSRYAGQVAFFGSAFQETLANQEWLVAGAGAIGCEVLKTLALMGVGTGPHGRISVVDPDRVQRPNLASQMLYRTADLRQAKAPAAARALRAINPAVEVRALEARMDSASEDTFGASFFEPVAGVMTAVDDSSSRLYIDSRCVAFRKPMVDGGKLGTMGSVQVFVPFESEMYASSRDPPEHKETPICTLRNFPYLPTHTLHWALDTFSSLFTQRPADVNAYLASRTFVEQQRKQPPSLQLPVLEVLRDSLNHRPLSFEACIQWGRLQFEALFANSIKQLVFNFPASMSTTAGAPFWSGTKRMPAPLEFDPADALHVDFVVAAANLQAQVYGLKGCRDRAVFSKVLPEVAVPPFQPKEGVRIAVTDSEMRGQRGAASSSGTAEAVAECQRLLEQLPSPTSLVGYRLTPLNFDVDDEESFAALFISAAATLRARNYGIPAADALEARLVAGRALPGLVTTAAVVGGLMCLEVYKLALGRPLGAHHHSFFNLALPLLLHAEPREAVRSTVATRTGKPLVWTLWDRFEMEGQGLTLEGFLRAFKEQHGLEISMLSHGKSLLFAEFLNEKKIKERMGMSLLDLVANVGKTPLSPTETYLTFSITCTDANDDDAEVPDVMVKVRQILQP